MENMNLSSDVSKSTLLFDIETDGFYFATTKVHVLSYAIDNGPVKRLVQPSTSVLKKWCRWADRFGAVCAHNALGFDVPVLTKLVGWLPKPRIIDTLVLSCLLDPEIQGGHSLEAWGMRLGEYKGSYAEDFKAAVLAQEDGVYNEGDEWLEYSDAMGDYCDQDVVVLQKLLPELRRRATGWDWRDSIDCEHKIAAIIAQQERNGWHFDQDLARATIQQINEEISQLDHELSQMLQWKVSPRGTGSPISRFTATGTQAYRYNLWEQAVIRDGHTVHEVEGQFCPIDLCQTDLNSRQQVLDILIEQGWKPTEYTDKGNPRFTEDSITDHIGPLGKKLARRFVCVTRRGQITGWLNSVRPDGRITAGAMPNATPTARMRHRGVVNVPRVGTPFGAELRSMFCAAPGTVQMGADASGLELRMLAHYMNDAAYTEAVVNGSSKDGTDVHTINCKLLGLDPKKLYEFGGKSASGRDVAKTFIYALLYGAGDSKIGSIIDGDDKAGARLRTKFLKGLPKLAILLERVKQAAKRGYLKGIDGRKVYVRHAHAALNSLLQSAGSIVVKHAIILFTEESERLGLKCKLVGTFHDEIQIECDAADAESLGELFCQCMKQVGINLNMRCELAGDYKIGKSWKDCH